MFRQVYSTCRTTYGKVGKEDDSAVWLVTYPAIQSFLLMRSQTGAAFLRKVLHYHIKKEQWL
jgi:hypothetical protein